MKFGETLSQQLFTARPDPQAPLALDQLCANAIKLPFHLPVGGRAEQRVELLHRLRQPVSQKKRIGLPATLRVFVG